jgi:uncharacterized YigZ family protein
MLSDEFWTISEPSTAQTRVLGSRFFAMAIPILSETELHTVIEIEHKKHYDASHHCWAMVVRDASDLLERNSDAGEPKGTAGLPILQEIKSRTLENCGVVVTRWFGGTKLGTGGLVRAYGECAALALEAATRVRFRTGVTMLIHAPFDLQSHVYHLAGKFAAAVDSDAAADGALMRIKLRRTQVVEFQFALTEQSAGKLTAQVGEPWIS